MPNPYVQAFALKRLPEFFSGYVARTEFSLLRLHELQKACVVYLLERRGQSSNKVTKNSPVSQLRENPQRYEDRKSAMVGPAGLEPATRGVEIRFDPSKSNRLSARVAVMLLSR
jgi:hypothetical protein